MTVDFRRALLRALFLPALVSVVVLTAVCLTAFAWLCSSVG